MTPPKLIIQPSLLAFSKELRRARLRAKMSQTKLARSARITRQGLVKIESGGNVTLGTIALLAHALSCEIGDFFPRSSRAVRGRTDALWP